jgi:coatomer subunit gamma
MNFDKKDEDTGALFHLDKTQVFQDARAFNASPIQPKKCRVILTKIKCTSTARFALILFFAAVC